MGTVDVVTSLCADEMTGVLPTSTSESMGVQSAAGSVRTRNDRELQVQFGQMFPKKDAGSLALLARETAVGQKSGEFDNEDLPSSTSGEDHALHAGFGASVHHTGKTAATTESRRQ